MLRSAMVADGHDTAEASGRRVAGSASDSVINFNVSVSLSCLGTLGEQSETKMTASFTWDVRRKKQI